MSAFFSQELTYGFEVTATAEIFFAS